MIASPYDLDVRYSQKRGTEWRGYKVHLTETCDEDGPNLTRHVATTAATDQDVTAVDGIHDGLAEKSLLPGEHVADGAYLSSDVLVQSRARAPADEAFKEQYKARAGVEGTTSEAVFALGMRRTRYRGRAKTHLQHVATAAAINLKRALAWLDGEPKAGTYQSHFARLAMAA